jgi:hypothetical protein
VKLIFQSRAVVLEHGGQKASHVLDHYGSWFDLVYQTQSCWEQVSLVSFAKLFAGNGKRRTWQTGCKEFDPLIWAAIKGIHVRCEDVPTGAVDLKCLSEISVDLDKRFVAETSLF